MFDREYAPRCMSNAEPDSRARFIRRTYAHLAGALLAFGLLEALLLQFEASYTLSERLLTMPYGWLMVLGAFMLVGWLCRGLANSTNNKGMQYMGLALYVVIEALIFVPLMVIALGVAGPGLLVQAGVMTGLLFAALTATVFITRKDFSFMKSALTFGAFVAMGLIVCAVLFGISLGTWFSVAMIVFAGGAILYDTSNVLHHYEEDQYVAASLELFASVALLLWYVIRLLMSRD
ncbi:MAG: Bax inhibitor-1/YccA family protein [Opitutaceae bacterium]